MAKAKSQPSKRSRAARRATSPSIDTDKSLKDVQPPKHHKPADRPSVLAVHHSAGVQKKTNQRKAHMSAKARKRREKGMEMAEAVMERTSNKFQRSLNRQRTVESRARGWDAINKDVNEDDDDDDDEDDEEMGEGAGEGKDKKTKAKKQKKAAQVAEETTENVEAAPVEAADDGLDEIL
ncbi:hypothetical protein PWT90_05874 [Aphanocladium album]|nr:hypothetical protein PWT90_05874 [Aphanocladium album]